MCVGPATSMADGQAEGELRDQLGDLEAQLQEIDAVLAATDGAEPELEAVSSPAQGMLEERPVVALLCMEPLTSHCAVQVRGELLESVAACRAALPPQGRIVGDGSYASHSHHGTVQIGASHGHALLCEHQATSASFV